MDSSVAVNDDSPYANNVVISPAFKFPACRRDLQEAVDGSGGPLWQRCLRWGPDATISGQFPLADSAV